VALFILQQATALRSKALGTSHHKTADAQFQLAEVWRTRNSPESSLQLHLQAYDTRRKIFGACHSLVAESQHAIGRLKFESAQFAEVRALFSVAARQVLVQAALVTRCHHLLCHSQARHWLQNALETQQGGLPQSALPTANLLITVLSQLASEALLPTNKDLPTARDHYLQAATICHSMLETASSSNIDGIDRISQTQEALLVWHAAVVASWEAKTKLAWELLRQGSCHVAIVIHLRL